jgi:hypothetical protein
MPLRKYNCQRADFKLKCSTQSSVNHCCAKFHENLTNDLVADTGSQREKRMVST